VAGVVGQEEREIAAIYPAVFLRTGGPPNCGFPKKSTAPSFVVAEPEFIFGDSIRAISQSSDRVQVEFTKNSPREFCSGDRCRRTSLECTGNRVW